MIAGSAVLTDLSAFRAQLQEHRASYLPLLHLNVWRPLRDITVDWASILLAAYVVLTAGWQWSPVAILVIANRQRALGNILHDAGHRNLHRSRLVNDLIAYALVAPLVLASLASYRQTHFKHHLQLGDAEKDPDYLRAPENREVGWKENYIRQLFSLKAWWGSVAGHLGSSQVTVGERLYIVAWWSLAGWLLLVVADASFLTCFVLLWFAARATVFHLITTFREMCDHFGLRPGGVVCFTRDVVANGIWYRLIHPRNNGYHLTHHLMPAVPYYHLPAAQRLFGSMPMYQRHGEVFASYVFGKKPVVAGWRTGGASCSGL